MKIGKLSASLKRSYSKLFIKNDSKTFFAYVNSKKRSNNKIGQIRNAQDEIIKNTKEIADVLNSYFASVFTKEDISALPEPVDIFKGSHSECLSTLEVDEKLVLDKLGKINVNKCQGPDELHGKFLFEIRHEIAKPLANLFSLSLETGLVPQEFRDANVCPLFKKG